jgi:anti-sigma28 factor (negative regulator of flagellin synthesis)
MEIRSVTCTGSVGAAAVKSPTGAAPRRVASDRVSTLDVQRATSLARGAQTSARQLRVVRLAHLGEAIRSGSYQPSASHVASRLLDAAEIDRHLQAVLTE